jgi:hypothetical protein
VVPARHGKIDFQNKRALDRIYCNVSA